jgi:hypothetical protein
VLRVSVAAYCPKYSSLSASPRDAAANLPPRIRPGDAYMPQMTRNRPESTGCDTKYEVGEALPPNGIRHTTGHTGKQPKQPALNRRVRGSKPWRRTERAPSLHQACCHRSSFRCRVANRRTPHSLTDKIAFTARGTDPDGRMPQCEKTPTQHRRGNCCIASTCRSRRSRRSWKPLKRRAFAHARAVRFSRAGTQPACAGNSTKPIDSSTDCTVDSRRHGRRVGGPRTLRDRSGFPRASFAESGDANPLAMPRHA